MERRVEAQSDGRNTHFPLSFLCVCLCGLNGIVVCLDVSSSVSASLSHCLLAMLALTGGLIMLSFRLLLVFFLQNKMGNYA